jgi:hypothetical protein
MSIPSLRAVCAAGLLFLAAGCGAESLELAPVRGKVSYRGQPLRSGSIVFAPHPVRNGPGPLARADIQPDGTFQLKSGTTLGAVPGLHRVTVVAVTETPAVPGQRFTRPRSLLPEKYRDPELSGLSYTVEAGRENVVNFNLD